MNQQDLTKLREPFSEDEIDWKVQRCGMRGSEPWAIVVPYVDARAIMQRLDEVAGPENWQTKLIPTGNGMLCELSIYVNDHWVSKMDGSDETDYEPFKGGISKALVRAAVHWGVGRELYNLPNVFARFVDKSTAGARYAKIEGKDFWWVPNTESLEKAQRKEEQTPAKPAAKEESNVPQATASQTKPAASTRPESIVQPGEAIVPFGHNQGKRLGMLSDQEIAGLADFYARVPDPKGKARVFKQQFERFLAERQRAS